MLYLILKPSLQKKTRGEYGRYIKFNYRLNFYRGSSYIPQTQITPDRVTTNTYGTINSYGGGSSYSGNSYSTIIPGAKFGGFTIPGGVRSRLWGVEVDCFDQTADFKKDNYGWVKLNGRHKNLADVITAKEIADEFCPQMDRLVAEARERNGLIYIEDTKVEDTKIEKTKIEETKLEETKLEEQSQNYTSGSININCNSPEWKDRLICNME